MSDKPLQLNPALICLLSPAEMRIFELLPNGLSCSQLAQRLQRSPKTVESHMSHIVAKLGVESYRQVLVLAVKFEGSAMKGKLVLRTKPAAHFEIL